MQRLLRYVLMSAFLFLASSQAGAKGKLGTSSQPIRLGVMLPLNNATNDGLHMLEYYRGVLMACDSLKKLGVSVDVQAWNVPENAVVSKILDQSGTKKLDLLIGPYYQNKVQALANFAEKQDVMMVVPTALDVPELSTNRHVFQVYQGTAALNGVLVERVCNWFKDYHPIIVDCSDEKSTRGSFTSALRKRLDQLGIDCNLTSLSSPASSFQNAFDKKKRNLVILNSSKTTYMGTIFSKLKELQTKMPDVSISVLGYDEWLPLAAQNSSNFHRFDTYLPTVDYANFDTPVVNRMAQKYRRNFQVKMPNRVPSYALAGFDQAFFFLRSIYKYGKTFDGNSARSGFTPMQTPLKFVRLGNGGYQNTGFQFVHYTSDRRIETINY